MEAIYEHVIGQGVLGVLLILAIVFFVRREKDSREEAKAKSIAHTEQMRIKDEKIQELNDKIHEMGISAVTTVKEFNTLIRELLK